jgi:hypothetical protein
MELMALLILIVGSVVVLLVYSAFQLYTSRWEHADRRVDRFQMFLVLIVLLDIPYIFLPFFIPEWQWPSAGAILPKVAVILGGAVPLFTGGWVALRKGPVRISLPAACLILVLCASFVFYVFFIFTFSYSPFDVVAFTGVASEASANSHPPSNRHPPPMYVRSQTRSASRLPETKPLAQYPPAKQTAPLEHGSRYRRLYNCRQLGLRGPSRFSPIPDTPHSPAHRVHPTPPRAFA